MSRDRGKPMSWNDNLLALAIASALSFALPAAGAGPADLDPRKAEDQAKLIDLLKTGEPAEKHRAATTLAKAGLIEALLDIVKDTKDYQTMLAIAHAVDERVIPVFEARLRAEPGNVYLVGSLAGLRSPKATPILLDLLRKNPDADPPSFQDMVGVVLNALMRSGDRAAAEAVRARFLAYEVGPPVSREEDEAAFFRRPGRAQRKSAYAQTLLAMGDRTPLPYLKSEMRHELAAREASSGAFEAVWRLNDRHFVTIDDEAILEPLLPELIEGVSSPDAHLKRSDQEKVSNLLFSIIRVKPCSSHLRLPLSQANN